MSAATTADAIPDRTAKKARLRWLIGAVIGIAVIAWLAHWWRVGRFIESTDDAYVGGDVTVISPKVAGFIQTLAVTDNQQVHRGDLLIRLDDRDYIAAQSRADAAVAAQQAALHNLDAQVSLQQSVVAQAKAGLIAAQAEAHRSSLDQTRYRDLVARAAVSEESAQKADADARIAQASTLKASAAIDGAQRQLDVLATQRAQILAALAQAQAELSLARLNEGYTVLRAPVDGSVGNRRAQVGAYATAASQLLAIVPAHGLWVDANFKEDQLARMHAGQEVEIRADAVPGRVFHGRLLSLAPATGAQFSVLPPENATGNFTKIVQRVPVRVQLEGSDGDLGQLRPGLSVTATVDTRS